MFKNFLPSFLELFEISFQEKREIPQILRKFYVMISKYFGFLIIFARFLKMVSSKKNDIS